MNFFLCLPTLCAVVAALIAGGRAGPTSSPPLFAVDAKAERESEDSNEVGPPEDWKLMQRMSKTATAFDPELERSRELAKEIGEFARIAQSVAVDGDDANATAATEAGVDVDVDDPVTGPDAESSDWIGAVWRNPSRDGDVDSAAAPSVTHEKQEAVEGEDGDGGNFEDIVRKISNDLKKLYVKVKQVMTVVKNWVNTVRGQRNYGFDEPLSASASESDGVFVIADPLIGDVDKSNKYTVPIHSD